MAVQRMRGVDASFLYWETPTLHMHTLKVSIVDPAGFPGGYSFDKFRKVLADALHLLPAFRLRPVHVPLELDYPVLIEDPEFDISRHVRRMQVPTPGGMEGLHTAVGEIASRQLRRGQPLWEITAVEGLEGGKVAFVVKIHHAFADGAAAVGMVQRVLQPVSGPESQEPPPPWEPDPIPGRGELLRMAAVHFGERVVHLPLLLWRTIVARLAILARRLRGVRRAGRPFRTPATRFDHALTPARAFSTAVLPFADLREVKDASGATVNDVVLAVCAGALRSYLFAKGELPDRPLVASVPVGTERATEQHLFGNHVNGVFATLPTHEADPLERVRFVQEVMAREKEELQIKGETMFEEWAEYRPGPLVAAVSRFYSNRRMAERHRSMFNLIVSNVPGPREPLQVGGALLTELYSVGPILEGTCLNITAWSYAGQLYVSLLTCPAHVPDIDDLATRLQPALDDLLAAVRSK